MLDMPSVREVFDSSTDLTVGIEEEFAILDPRTHSLDHRFEELARAARQDDVLADAVAGELIRSEIEIRSGRGETFAHAVSLQQEARSRLFALAARQDALLACTGTHPWSTWQEQRIIDTEHYHRVEDRLQYVAWRNNTFSVHVHVGVRGAERAIGVCDRLRAVMPQLLAVSANSPFLDGRHSGLHSARSQIFTKSFPRCGIPDSFGSWDAYAGYIDFLARSGSISEFTEVWWSVRPHHAYGTVEMRICDAQSGAGESTALAALITACVAQAALDHDEGRPFFDPPARLIEENFWRAIRHGLDGRLIDLERAEEYPAAAAAERLLEWTAPARAATGIDPLLPEHNGAQRQKRALAAGASIEEVYRAEVELTQQTYAVAAHTRDAQKEVTT
jgi:glutamate---cysteine ligase / carboxylate-amine ligase